MTASIVSWTIAALLLFWAVGAYNRLMRLRGDAKAAFAQLDAELTRDVDLVRKHLPVAETQSGALESEPSIWSGLHGAAEQFAASLSAARTKPLDSEGIAALSAAHAVLAMAWERAERSDSHDLAGPRLPETVLARRAQIAAQSRTAAEQFDQAVIRYNTAIAQFPAVLLATLFGFRPGRALLADTMDA